MYFGLALLYLKRLYVGSRDSSCQNRLIYGSAKLGRYLNTSSVCPDLLDSVDDHRMALRIREITALCNFPSDRRHTAHEQQAEARISYRFHPRFGETVGVRRRLKRGGTALVVVHQLDGTFACLPVWMTDEAAYRFEIGDDPRVPLNHLRSLRSELDLRLSF